MKKITNIFSAPFVFGVVVAIAALSSIDHAKFGVWQWCIAVLVVLVLSLVLGAIFSFAVFAPVYWLLGKLHSKRAASKSGTSDGDET